MEFALHIIVRKTLGLLPVVFAPLRFGHQLPFAGYSFQVLLRVSGSGVFLSVVSSLPQLIFPYWFRFHVASLPKKHWSRGMLNLTHGFSHLQLTDRFSPVRGGSWSSAETSVVCDFKARWLQKWSLCPPSQSGPLYWKSLPTPSWAKTYFEMLLVDPRPSTNWFWSTSSPSCPSQASSNPVRKSRRPWLLSRMWAQTFRIEVRSIYCFTRRKRVVLEIELGFHSNREFRLGRWVLKQGVDSNKSTCQEEGVCLFFFLKLGLSDLLSVCKAIEWTNFFCSVTFTHTFGRGNLFVLPWHAACGILVPQQGIKSAPPALQRWSLIHWTAREAWGVCFYDKEMLMNYWIDFSLCGIW